MYDNKITFTTLKFKYSLKTTLVHALQAAILLRTQLMGSEFRFRYMARILIIEQGIKQLRITKKKLIKIEKLSGTIHDM